MSRYDNVKTNNPTWCVNQILELIEKYEDKAKTAHFDSDKFILEDVIEDLKAICIRDYSIE